MNKQNKLTIIGFIALAAMIAASPAMAGSDATFGSATTGPLGTMTTWMTGSMGKMFAIGTLATGLGIGIVKQSVMAVAIGVGIALSASAGPAVLSAMFTAIL